MVCVWVCVCEYAWFGTAGLGSRKGGGRVRELGLTLEQQWDEERHRKLYLDLLLARVRALNHRHPRAHVL